MIQKQKIVTCLVLTPGQLVAACRDLACSTRRSGAPWDRHCLDQLNGQLVFPLCNWTLAAPPRPLSGSSRLHQWWAPLAWPSCGRHHQSGSPGPMALTGPSDRPPQSSRLHEGLCPPSSPIPANCLHGHRGREEDRQRNRGRERQKRGDWFSLFFIVSLVAGTDSSCVLAMAVK